MTRFLGPTGKRRRLTLLGAGLSAASLLALIVGPAVLAVHDYGVFQLDGDAVTNSTLPPASDDWDKVCHQVTGSDCSTTLDTTGAKAKDGLDISNWAWKDAGGLPDKDNLLHAFAARYTVTGTGGTTDCPTGTTCDALYFGSDRLDNSGDAQQGFWFLQNACDLGSGKGGGGTTFKCTDPTPGADPSDDFHRIGDLLILSDFSNGGGTSTINIYKWNGSGLTFLAGGDGFKCDPTLTGDDFCGIVNSGTITMPWSFTDKSGTPSNGALNGEFFEAGVNLSSPQINLGGECFASLVSETRSSVATTATLKDFVIGKFAPCVPSLTTQASTSGPVSPGEQVRDTATITVTGATNPNDATGTIDFFLCGPDANANPDCSTGGTSAGAGKTLVDTSSPANTHDGISGANSDYVNTSGSHLAPGYYCFRAEANLTNYSPNPDPFHNATTECFRVRDTSTTTTAQDWLPNDTATVKLSDGTTNGSGTVTFTLYENGTCTAPSKATFGPITLVNGKARTSNTTLYLSPGTTISWKVHFTSTDPNILDSDSNCESSSLTISD